MSTKILPSKSLAEMRKNILQIADKLNDDFQITDDLNKARIADKHYKSALQTIWIELKYKMYTGEPIEIPFVTGKQKGKPTSTTN